MAKQRYVNTEMWTDSWFADLDPVEKLLFMYLLTNDSTNIAGVYQLPIRRMAADTGIDREMVSKILSRFADAGKVLEKDGWIIIINHLKHQNLESDNTLKGIQRVIDTMPFSVKKAYGIIIRGLQGAYKGLAYLNLDLNLNLNLNLDLNLDGDTGAPPEISDPVESVQQDQVTAIKSFGAIKSIFEHGSSALSPDLKPYYHDGREAKAVKLLEARYDASPGEFQEDAQRFLELIRSGDKFWGSQPFTPSAFNSLYNRIRQAKHPGSTSSLEATLRQVEAL